MVIRVTPQYEELVAQSGLDDFDEMMRLSGTNAGMHSSREVCRIEVEGLHGPISLYLKREWQTYVKDRIRSLFEGYGWSIKSMREWRVLEAMRENNIPAPEPVVVAQRGLFRPQGYLVVRSLPASTELTQYLPTHVPDMSTSQRRDLARHIGKAIANLHNAGIDQPDLFAKHLFIEEANHPSGQPTIHIIDMQRSRVRRVLSTRTRVRDLSSLDATIPDSLVGWTDRVAFLRAYLRASGSELNWTDVARQIRQRATKLRGRRKIREMMAGHHTPNDRYVPLDGRGLCASKDWIPVLRAGGLERFEKIMRGKGRVLRSLRSRDNVVMELPTENGQVRAYLKRHHGWYLGHWIRERIFGQRCRQPGFHEAAQIIRLERTNIATMELIAYGQKIGVTGYGESFLMTREVPDAIQLDHLLEQRFSGALNPTQRARLLSLVKQLADISRRFHGAGYNHQDFYLCHFLVRLTDDQYSMHLIDLQRVQYRRRFRSRWVVKDLGQLNYSAPEGIISRTDKLRFLKHYLKVSRLGPQERRLIRRILRKTAKIAAHDKKLQCRRPSIPIAKVLREADSLIDHPVPPNTQENDADPKRLAG